MLVRLLLVITPQLLVWLQLLNRLQLLGLVVQLLSRIVGTATELGTAFGEVLGKLQLLVNCSC